MNFNQQEECQKIFKHYGRKRQLIQLSEELGELQSAIARELAGKPNNFTEELADVMIMTEQFNTPEAEHYVKRKLDRQVSRILAESIRQVHDEYTAD